MMIKVNCYGTLPMRLGYIFNDSDLIDFECWISQKDFLKYRNEFTGDEKWLHVVKNNIFFLIPGIFWLVNRSKADIYLLSQNGLFVAFPLKSRRVVYFPNGYDFTVAPFPHMYVTLKSLRRPFNLCQRIFRSLVTRTRLKKVKNIWCTPFPVFLEVFRKLKRTDFQDDFFPVPTHLDLGYLKQEDVSSNLESLNLNCDFLLFNPNRVIVENSPRVLESGHVKGTDISVRAFANFLSNTSLNACLVLIDRGEPDIKRINDLISELGISNNIVWIKPRNSKTGLSRREMSKMYEKSYLVFGEFGAGWFGLTTIEAAYFSKPIVCFAEEEFMSRFFAFNPFLSSKNVVEVKSYIERLSASKDFRSGYASLSRKWFDDYFSDEAVKRFWSVKFLNLYRKLN